MAERSVSRAEVARCRQKDRRHGQHGSGSRRLALIAALCLAWCSPLRAFQADVGKTLALVEQLAKAGNYREAALVLEEALPEQESIGEAALRVRLAEILRPLRRVEQAYDELDRAERLLDGTSVYQRQLKCYLTAERCRLNLIRGLLDVAVGPLKWARQELLVLESEGHESATEHVKLDFVEALLLRSQENWPGLQAHVERALDHEAYEQRPRDAAILESRLAPALTEQARDEPALAEAARRSLDAIYSLDGLEPSDLVEPDLVLAELDLRERQWAAAREHLDRAAERLGSASQRRRDRQGPTWYALHSRWVQERTDPTATTEELVQLRSELRLVLETTIAEWRQRPLRKGGYGLQRYLDERGLISELMRVEMRITPGSEGCERALSHLLAAEDAGTLVRQMASGPSSLEVVRSRMVGPDAADALLVFFAGADDNHAFVIEPTDVRHVRIEHHDRVKAAQREAVQALHRAPRDDDPAWLVKRRTAGLTKLGEMVLPRELRDRLESWTRVTIVGAQDIPFEALPYAESFFGARFAVDYAPSLALGALLAERATTTTYQGRLVVGGVPLGLGFETTRSDLERLIPSPRKEVSHLLFGRELTLELLQAELPKADVWTLVTHGGRDDARERTTVVAVTGSSEGPAWVGAREFEHFDAPAIVAFAVCGSERGPQRWGDASASTLAGALFSGSRTHCVVQSSFDLDEGAALTLFEQWHAELERGASPAEALRRAREDFAGGEVFADPFYHGLIRVVGFGQRSLGPR